MISLSADQKIKISTLFKNNKFSELEFEIESISNFKNRSAFLANMLGVVILKKGSVTQKDFEKARILFKDSYEKDPDNIDAMCNLGHVSLKLKNYEYIFKELKRFIKNKGYNPKVNETLARIYYFTGQLDEALQLYKEMSDKNDLTKDSSAHFLSSLNYSSKFSQAEYLNYCKKINKKFIPKDLHQLIELDVDKNSKNLKNKGFKVHAFNLRKEEQLDSVSQSLMKVFDCWHNLAKLSDLNVANIIRKNKINILINLVGYFAGNRFTIMKYKAAPLQMIWMGYVNTTGIEEIDYIVADPNLIKKSEENLYSEKIIKLPKIWNCHSGIDSDIKVGDLPFLKNNYITFGSFNNSSKINNDVIETWSQILLRKSNSKIIIKAPSTDSEIAQENILKKFKEFNVESSRVLFSKREKKREDHYKLYNKVDISLDTFPYPGVTTSIESIWMGVPVLTLKGNNFVSRCGESINLNLGMQKFTAENKNEYINKALSLSEDLNGMIKIRKSLREKALNSPLFNIKNFGKDFCELLNNVWDKHSSK
jgi:protein O-GlcNAc transferase